MISKNPKNVLLFSIHRTDDWFRHLGRNMGFENSYVVSCMPNEGDYSLVNEFGRQQKQFYLSNSRESDLLSAKEVVEVISRCRVLRFMGERRAAAMTLAMAVACEKVLDLTKPSAIVSFPIDRYVSDVLEKLGKKRGIPFFELTVSALPEMSMLMKRGEMCKINKNTDSKTVDRFIEKLTAPLFKPSYVQGVAQFTQLRFLRIFFYFRLRGLVFWLISMFKGDPLNIHYLDAQSFLGHKPSLSDRNVTRFVDYHWREKVESFVKAKRVFFGLQLFPEASIDYWIHDLDLIEHEDLIVEAARAFSEAGYCVLVKDHPLQFGFRQLELIERLMSIQHVIFVPYQVDGLEALALCGVNFTCTGTLGLQAALMGVKSITTPNYYTTDGDFVLLEKRSDVAFLPQMVEEFPAVDNLKARQYRLISNLLQGGFESDFFSFRGFDPKNPSSGATELGKIIGKKIRKLLTDS